MLTGLKLKTSVLFLVMILSACSTSPSIQLISPNKKLIEVKLQPPESVKTECEKLKNYDSDSTRDAIKTTIENNKRYGICAGKMKSAIEFILQLIERGD